MDVDVRGGFEYPLQGEGTLRLFAVGGGVPLAATVVLLAGYVVAAVAYEPAKWVALAGLVAWVPIWVGWLGYYVRVVRSTAAGEAAPPEVDDRLALARDGVVGALLGVGYLLPLLVVYLVILLLVGVAVGGLAAAVSEGSAGGLAAAGAFYLLVSLVGTAVTFGYGLLASYCYPISLSAYAHGGLRAAVSPRRLWGVAASANYGVPWLLVAGVSLFCWTVLSFLVSLLVGYLLLPLAALAGFYLVVVAGRLFGTAYALETDAGGRRDRSTGDARRAEGAAGE